MALSLADSGLAAPVIAEAVWPAGPVRMIPPVPRGGAFDATVRLIQEPDARLLGQSVVVKNRGGGAGIPAADAVIRSTDGHSFRLVGSSHAINATLIQNLPWAMSRRSTCRCIPCTFRRSLAELLEAARAASGSTSYGSPGIGLSQHLAVELLRIRAGVQITHLPYRGASPALSDGWRAMSPWS